MRIHLLSDLHLGYAPMDLPQPEADLLILAGDIHRPAATLNWLKEVKIPVVYVLGNHEFYGSSFNETYEFLTQATANNNQLRWLQNSSWEFNGIRILGTSLWSDFLINQPDKDKLNKIDAESISFMRDFSRIIYKDEQLFTPADARAEFAANLAWLKEQINTPFAGKTLVVTHHAPSPMSIENQFAGSLLNANFVSNLEYLMGKDKVDVWVHGHTHASFDYEINGTRVICNPRGYAKDLIPENPSFNPEFVFQL